MGKGDRRTKKGKRFRGSYGKYRPNKRKQRKRKREREEEEN
jgi:30S ribosomal protein S31